MLKNKIIQHKKIVITIILILLSYGWGLASYKYTLFPYSTLKKLTTWFYPTDDRRITFSDTSIKTPFNCSNIINKDTMVALVFGQSNAANNGQSIYSAKQAVFNFFEGACYRASDPLLGATGNNGSPWTRLGDKIIAHNLYANVLLVPIAVSESEIKRWDIGGDLHYRIIAAIQDLKAHNIKITHMLWHQGESDALLKTSKAEYKSRFLSMLATIRENGVNAPIYIASASRCSGRGVSPEIRAAQFELVNIKQGIYAGADTDGIDLVGDRYDGCHFSAIGLDKHAEQWLHAITPKP